MAVMGRTHHLEECRSEKLEHLDRQIGLNDVILDQPCGLSAHNEKSISRPSSRNPGPSRLVIFLTISRGTNSKRKFHADNQQNDAEAGQYGKHHHPGSEL
jgi:hypothetical protein